MKLNMSCSLIATTFAMALFAIALFGCDAADDGAHDTAKSEVGAEDDIPPTLPHSPVKTEVVCCEKAGDVMPYWSDSNCRTYFVCEGQEPYLHTCPVGEAFSAELNRCVNWARVSCSAQNKAVWLAMEAATLIREASSPGHVRPPGGGAKQMIDTRGLAHKLRDPSLEKVKRLQGLLRHKDSWVDNRGHGSASSGPIIPVELSSEVCLNRRHNPAQISSLLNTVLQAQAGCPGKSVECRLPYLDVRCETSDSKNSGGYGVNRGHDKVNEGHQWVNRGHEKANRGHERIYRAAYNIDENHFETEEETVTSREHHTGHKEDEIHHSKGGESSEVENQSSHLDDKQSRSQSLGKDSLGTRTTINVKANNDNNNNNNNSNEKDDVNGLKERRSTFSVWSTDYANGYQVQDSNTEILFPDSVNDRGTHYREIQSGEKVGEVESKEDSESSETARGEDKARLASDTTNHFVEERRLLADNDLFALRDHRERKIRESLQHGVGQE